MILELNRTSEKRIPIGFIRSCHPYARRSASQAVLSRMQLTLHETRRTPHGASRLVLAMSAWSVKTRCAPSRHCKDARVYGHTTTTAMHDNEYPLPPWVGFPSSAARQPTRCPSTERYVFGKFPARFFQRRLFFWHRLFKLSRRRTWKIGPGLRYTRSYTAGGLQSWRASQRRPRSMPRASVNS